MSEPCLEIIVFKVKDTIEARRARMEAHAAMKTYDGFISWSGYEGLDDADLFADLVLWRDPDCAKAAANRLLKDPAFAATLAEMNGLLTLSRFTPARLVPEEMEPRARAA
ncbi:hypothetical protein FMN50_02650 [Rhodobacterales bacterium]|nr:hypothetical protein FMN50_02650 [Rhodobacterales bacterium]